MAKSKNIRVEFALYGKNVTEIDGPVASDSKLGWIAMSANIGDGRKEILKLVRKGSGYAFPVDNRAPAGLGQLMLFDHDGLWIARFRWIRESGEESGGRSVPLIQILHFPDFTNWTDLSPGLILSVLTMDVPEPPVMGDPELQPALRLRVEDVSDRVHQYFTETEKDPVALVRLSTAYHWDADINESFIVKKPSDPQFTGVMATLPLAIELEALVMLFRENGVHSHTPFVVDAGIPGGFGGFGYAEDGVELDENDATSDIMALIAKRREKVDASAGKVELPTMLPSKDGQARRIGRDPYPLNLG